MRLIPSILRFSFYTITRLKSVKPSTRKSLINKYSTLFEIEGHKIKDLMNFLAGGDLGVLKTVQ